MLQGVGLSGRIFGVRRPDCSVLENASCSYAVMLVLSCFSMDYRNLLVKVLLCHLTGWQVVYLFSCLQPLEVIVTNAVVLLFLSLTLD